MRMLSESDRSADATGQLGANERRAGIERWLSDACVHAALGRPPRARSIPVLRNAFLDRWFARTHPALPALVFAAPVLGLSAFSVREGGALSGVLSFAAGCLGFSLFEYLLHRFVFHHPFGGARQQRIAAFLLHGYHHSYPNDPDRLVLPPALTVPFAFLLGLLDFWLFPRAIAAGALAGTAAGYTVYDSLHWWIHHGRARSALGRWCRRYHLLHHRQRVAGFGVSSPLWDLVFGTYLPGAGRVRGKARHSRLAHG